MKTTHLQLIHLDNKSYELHPALDGFSINFKPSTNIEFFGYSPDSQRLFVQFRMGTIYFFSGVPQEVHAAALECESIGKFFHAHIKGQYPSEGIATRYVTRHYSEV